MTLKELVEKFYGDYISISYSENVKDTAIELNQNADGFELDDWLAANSMGDREVFCFETCPQGNGLLVSVYKERSKG